jgi:exosortase C (VPDSG-CTERM-specific)
VVYGGANANSRKLKSEISVTRLQQTQTAAATFYVGAITFMFGAPLIRLFKFAQGNEMNSYLVLVPFVCAYLLWIRRGSLANPSRPAYFAGLSLIAAATFVWALALAFRPTHWMPDRADQLTVFTLSIVLYVWAGGFLFLGRDWMRSTAFPMFFLIFMVPLPSALVDALESASKLASAEAANMFFAITGTPTLRDGNIFQLPGITIEVAQECSGIRSSYMLILTSLLAGNLFLTKAWSRILLVLFVIPLGIIRNGFRVWFIATLCIHIGPQMIHSAIHRRGGPAFFILSLIPLLLLVWLLRWVERKRGIETRGSPSASPPIAAIGTVSSPRLSDSVRNT